mmetsp:Transcript_22842/g.63528  ORF Transcript_22842/g.63528 Transcript_22842/m.63528 type:complete len:589 (-) Transcript_22842:262-2028(-)
MPLSSNGEPAVVDESSPLLRKKNNNNKVLYFTKKDGSSWSTPSLWSSRSSSSNSSRHNKDIQHSIMSGSNNTEPRRRSSSIVVVSLPRELQELAEALDRQDKKKTTTKNSSSNNDGGDHELILDNGMVIERQSPWATALEMFKYAYSTLLWLLSLILITAAILQEQTVSNLPHPLLTLAVFGFLIAWLSMMEGGQGCLVGLQPIDKESYRTSHPLTFQNTTLAHKGDNLERFIVGRQFLVVLVVFGTNLLAGTVEDATVLGLPSTMIQIALDSGLALMMITISTGQLMSQTNSSDCMLDLINNRFMLVMVTHVSLAIEWSGLLHAVYAVKYIFTQCFTADAPQQPESTTAPRTTAQQVFFVARTMFSVALLALAWAVTLAALFQGQTDAWDGLPAWASVVLFLGLMAVVGFLEGLQIALFAAINLTDDELKAQSPHAHHNCQLVFEGQNLAAFLIGRQIVVTICMFVVARITTISLEEGHANLWGVSDGLQDFFNTGLLGALITAIHASLIWRVIASAAPFVFLSSPLTTMLIRLCLAVEQSGLCSVAWILARAQKFVFQFHPDHEYLGDGGDDDDDDDDDRYGPQRR